VALARLDTFTNYFASWATIRFDDRGELRRRRNAGQYWVPVIAVQNYDRAKSIVIVIELECETRTFSAHLTTHVDNAI